MSRITVEFRLSALMLFAALLGACGGGGGSSSSQPAVLTITTDAILAPTLANSPYSATLRASGGNGGLSWSIAPSAPTALFVDGLSMNSSTGVLSGTANFQGTAGFMATVRDSSSHTATKAFYLTAYSQLQPPAPQSFTFSQYEPIWHQQIQVNGGLPPLNISVTGTPLPIGVTLDRETGIFRGSPMTTGNFYTTVTIRDSYAPTPETTSVQISIQVAPPPFSIAQSLPSKLPLNRPFSGKIVALGGIPPYTFAMTSGSLPPGLSPMDTGTGQISGTPTTAGYYFFYVSVTDSSSPPLSATASFGFTVAAPLGRNDTIATATAIDNGNFFGSISPYIDPPNAAPLPADSDYYKLISISGATVHLATGTQQFLGGRLLDTVIEILDANGTRLATCNQPGNTSTNFTSTCLNDDIPDPPTTDSALDFKVPGSPSTTTTFYVHVLDWRGDARPDMLYGLSVSGVVDALKITSTSLIPAARGLSYTQQLTSANGTGPIMWAVSSGSLPPGITLSPSGALTGPAITDGTYSFTVQASDSSTPPQIVTAPEQIQVVEPVKIVSSPTLPAACANKPYTFALQSSGGIAPLFWGFVTFTSWPGINLDSSTGIFSGTSFITGTFPGKVVLSDPTGHAFIQDISLTVNQCP